MSGGTASGSIARYRQRRQRFFDLHHRQWPGTLIEPYDVLDPREVGRHAIEDIRKAARGVMHVYDKISRIFKDVPEPHLRRLGLPDEVVTLAGVSSPISHSLFARLDLVQSTRGVKLLECNFDSPGLIVETFAINALACESMSINDPNASARRALTRRLYHAIESSAEYLATPVDECRVRICARSQYTRDVDAAQYIVNELQQNNQINVNYLPLDEMRMDDLGLYDARGHKIDVLIRLYPLYRFCRAGIPHRKKPGCTLDHRMLHECLIRRQLVMLNTPLATVLETKAIQALIWRLYESGVYFGQKDRELIHRYFLRTTFEPPPGQDPVVVKPMYGGGGSDVIVSDPDGNILERGRTSHNKGDPCIYQEYVEPPEVETMTEDGVKTLRVIVSAWVIDGRYVGVSYRTGQGITDASWWISPIYVGERISI